MSSTCTDPCKPQACAIQACLKRHGYDESKCTVLIDSLYECCSNFYRENGQEARSPCCPVPRLLEFKVEQRKQEQLDAKLIR
ncbi:uncharacterized protein C5L36_0E04180 [Pichia kudriavzevii]|uniref:Cx9C motif-containing protein 4, mitochondrial n=1 Tax=Pichia kudriavzevii TaxID=4909 RepID=A0A1V2LKA9_PICKU|nr:uncharacterized protein C5L36_0E04180 [Pichia kudriavzevii]AWU78363.1 hypothetical protein C5L36_0E04180 [Pichia kudriavzevii]ONH72344.1 Cx9C motif-containing protein 4, mitochondrial [Pichia kudriavzevii]